MPILQNKLVIKSIEALHDEALALVHDTDTHLDITATPVVLQTKTPPQESPIFEPKDTLADASPETAVDHNIMARIDHLLRKLDEDEDVAIAPPSEKVPKSNEKDQTNDALNSTADKNSDGSREGKKPRPEQTQALADIAEAIYQAQQQATDTFVADVNKSNSIPFDVNVLSATVADEVRRTVSAVMIAELPRLVRNAVGEEIRALPANALSQSKPAIDNPSAAKTVAARKTSTAKKSLTKKTVAKKASGKTGTKKLRPKKMGTKTTTKTTPST